VARALGIGGVFFKCRDAAKLADWYRQWLDFPVDPQYLGASFLPHTIPPGGYTVWGAFRADTDYFNPSEKEFMFNVMVDDLDGALARVREGGAEVMEEIQDLEFGRFGWFIDPEGNKVELWQPKPAAGG
jgi:predicted enzyme related to lactoylglutathione lyase